jgi:glycosyltransferase involved in cell wall biosynthesis
MRTPLPSPRTAVSAGTTQPGGAAFTEAPAFDAAQVAAELQSAARHVRVPDGAGPSADPFPGVQIAVLIPCHNEAATIGAVVRDFRAALPRARIAVFDNASKDDTIAQARAAGAEVFAERRRGKGNVVRRMFAEISADVYVMVDGDGTYDASAAPQLVAMIVNDRADMAIGVRANVKENAHRAGHALGNRLFNRLYGALFGYAFRDIFSGYRAFSRRFVKSFPALSSGFEIETELSVHATQLRLPIGEIVLPYGARAEGSASKLRSIGDGWRILRTFAYLLKETRPALFFGLPAAVFLFAAMLLALPLVETYLATGLVPRLPTAILCMGLVILACMSATCGLILDSLARFRVEQKRMLYLALTQRDG